MSFSIWFRGLRGQFLALIMIGVLALATVVGVAIYGLEKIKLEVGDIESNSVPSLVGLAEVNEGQMAVMYHVYAATQITSASDLKESEKNIEERFKQIDEGFEKYSATELDKNEKRELDALTPKWATWKKDVKAAFALCLAGKTKEAEAYLLEVTSKSMRETEAGLDSLLAGNKKSVDVSIDRIHAGQLQIFRNFTIVSLLSCLFMLIFGIYMARKVTGAIGRLVVDLNNASANVAAASTQIASSSEILSQSNTEQAASLEETAASIEELSAMVVKNTDNAKNTASTSEASKEKSNEGKANMERMMASMGEINNSNEAVMTQMSRSNQQMAEIVTVIQEIGNKTKVINDIVFQTKLLSFNASVEAARAGEHGRGFAVVAEEVGNLAQMSGNAAKEISEMLDGSISKVEGIVRETKQQVETLLAQGKEKVKSGVELAHQCNEALNEIVVNISRVSNMASEISTASGEQSQGIGEINKAMSQINIVTQQNSATSEQAASAAEELSAQASSLKASVRLLVRTIEGVDELELPAQHSTVVKLRDKEPIALAS